MADHEGDLQQENVDDDAALQLAAIGEGHAAAKMMIVGAGARFLFYPTLLYNVIRNKLQPEFRWWDEIGQFLLLGAVPFPGDIPRLKDAGVHAVVTLNESYETLVPTSLYKVQGIDHLVIPTRDYLFAPSFTDIQRAVAFIHEHAQMRKRTYVHCKAGRGRSATVVICYLVEHRGMTPMEALHYVRSRRPRILLAASQWQAVLDYTEHCRMRGRLLLPAPVASKEAGMRSEDESDEEVVVSRSDLLGYRGIEDAGLVGNNSFSNNEFIGVVYRLRQASSAWKSKLSSRRFWVGNRSSSTAAAAATSNVSTAAAAPTSCKTLASSMFATNGLEVLVS